MRILVLSNIDLGLYKFRKELLEEFVKNNEVFVSIPEGEYFERIKEIGCSIIPCSMMDRRGTNPINDLRLFAYYKRIIRNLKPDIVLTYTIKPNVYGGLACRQLGIPYLANITGLGSAIENGGILSYIAMFLYRVGLKKAKCVFFQNKDNEKLFCEKRIFKGKRRLIPGSGVNLEAHSFELYPDDTDGIRFLYVGRIMKDKGIDELLHAINIVRSDNRNIKLNIVGFCEEDYTNILEEADKTGVVVYYGQQHDVHSFYKSCHCTVLPSYYEGMANVLLESSATGRPVIATRIPGCKETFEEGVTGFGCEARDADSLINAIQLFLNTPQNKRIQMGIEARKKMEKEFDRSIVIQAYKDEIVKY